ncbi:ribose-5-phosphate isomerase RpiA [Lederbergia galactosidilytica]|uniref:Ribose-5-phosphate isomerase A n=1 Tax=Lederbergia galactosidilytica TaxID=217031 RepID=A0A177ZHB5_9BACI|nr:ribose-5-phosphate isomerase RpiA [Lederbergia galactosidilytica]MBP1914195.1 ribose 5-phosphate isomerase A [Lederbergia galactosidilytica]OAK67351.1 ribose 5-phosphate isomerase [Lederbergia galactosidilytica]
MLKKQLAGEKAVEFIEDGMVIGLGSGSTVFYTIQKIGELVGQGLRIQGVSTSRETTLLAQSLNIPLVSIDSVNEIDLTIDGADEVDRNLQGIKGGGGALLYEKIVASASRKIIWVVDASKMVESLGKFPLPIEVVPFGHKQVIKKMELEDCQPILRVKNGSPVQTDGGHYIVDLHMNKIEHPQKLEEKLQNKTGIVENGLFLNYAHQVIIGGQEGVKIKTRDSEK